MTSVCNAYRYFAGQALLITSQSRSRMEYLSPTYTTVVHDITLIWRRNLISLAGFTTIFWKFGCGLIFGQPFMFDDTNVTDTPLHQYYYVSKLIGMC